MAVSIRHIMSTFYKTKSCFISFYLEKRVFEECLNLPEVKSGHLNVTHRTTKNLKKKSGSLLIQGLLNAHKVNFQLAKRRVACELLCILATILY
jgi:hypothetical protein